MRQRAHSMLGVAGRGSALRFLSQAHAAVAGWRGSRSCGLGPRGALGRASGAALLNNHRGPRNPCRWIPLGLDMHQDAFAALPVPPAEGALCLVTVGKPVCA